MAKKEKVKCSFCGEEIYRVTWNPAKKRPILNSFCDNVCKGKWQTKQRESLGYTKEWLVDEYCVKAKSADQIAREIGRDPKTVWRWITDYGIKMRQRGTDYGQCFKEGHESYWKGKKLPKETREKIRDARLRDGHVPYLKNGRHWLHETGRKPASWRGGITPERQSFYATKEWASAVRDVWKRDKAVCQRCKKNHNTIEKRGTFHIHHIISFQNKEKRSDVGNLILLCRECHLWVHSKKNINKDFIGD